MCNVLFWPNSVSKIQLTFAWTWYYAVDSTITPISFLISFSPAWCKDCKTKTLLRHRQLRLLVGPSESLELFFLVHQDFVPQRTSQQDFLCIVKIFFVKADYLEMGHITQYDSSLDLMTISWWFPQMKTCFSGHSNPSLKSLNWYSIYAIYSLYTCTFIYCQRFRFCPFI